MSNDELLGKTDKELQDYLDKETEELINRAPEGHIRERLRGLAWSISMLRKTKYKDNPMGLCVELSKRMFDNLSELQKQLLKIKGDK